MYNFVNPHLFLCS